MKPKVLVKTSAGAQSRTTVINSLLICGIAVAVVQIAGDMLASAFYPGYSYVDQSVSELSAIGAPTRSFLVVVGVEEIVTAADRERPDGFTHAAAHVGMAFKEHIRPCRTVVKAGNSFVVLVVTTEGRRHYYVNVRTHSILVHPNHTAAAEERGEVILQVTVTVRMLIE